MSSNEALAGFDTRDITNLNARVLGHRAAFNSKRQARLLCQIHDNQNWSIKKPCRALLRFVTGKYDDGLKELSIFKLSEDPQS